MIQYYKNLIEEPGYKDSEVIPSEENFKNKIEIVRSQISHYQQTYSLDKTITSELDQLVSAKGKKALFSLYSNDSSAFDFDPDMHEVMRVIVKMDGSRPTYLIKDGSVDFESNIASTQWNKTIEASNNALSKVLPNIGRIYVKNDYRPFAGTGFLIHQDLLITNRHVLQTLAYRDIIKKEWIIDSTALVDFKCEYKSSEKSIRKFKKVIFAPERTVKDPIDHSIGDIAILELEPIDQEVQKPFKLKSKLLPGDKGVYIIGYPAKPQTTEYDLTALEKLFVGEFGCKRLTPGKIISSNGLPASSFAHDSTTLGGNSGSVVLFIDQEDIAAGIHYGGTRQEPRSNFSHYITKLTDKDCFTQETIAEKLLPYKISFT